MTTDPQRTSSNTAEDPLAWFGGMAERIDAVVIGTSAGGVEALSVLLPALPVGLRASVFVVLHLPRGRPSLLAEIFGKRCALPVFEAQDKEPVRPGSICFAPPDYHLLIDHDVAAGLHTALSLDEPVHYSRPSIDVLFESAADRYGNRLLGIILTGANQDGARGLAAVYAAGGVTLVQEPQTALAPLMPESALLHSPPGKVLPLDQLARLLHALPHAGMRGFPVSP